MYSSISICFVFFLPCALGCDVRLLLHGTLHGKLLHHTQSGLPEIYEQPEEVQEGVKLQ